MQSLAKIMNTWEKEGFGCNEGMTWKCEVRQEKMDLKRTSIEEGNDEQ